MSVAKIIQILIIIALAPTFLKAEEAESGEQTKVNRRSQNQWYATVATWRESSIITRSDGVENKLNTLNTVGRFGLTNYFGGGKYYLRYGLLLGHSENGSAVDAFLYFQRSVLLTGAEAALGIPFYLSPGVEMNLSLGGIYRTINHSVPSSEYKVTTKARFIPMIALEYLWRLTQSVYWRQSVGTQGKAGDTLWSAGFGYDW